MWKKLRIYRENEASIFDGKSLFLAKHAGLLLITYLGAAGQNEKYIIKKEWISQSSKYFHSSWKMT